MGEEGTTDDWQESPLSGQKYVTWLATLTSVKYHHDIPPNLYYKQDQIPKLKGFSSRLAVVFAQTIEVKC